MMPEPIYISSSTENRQAWESDDYRKAVRRLAEIAKNTTLSKLIERAYGPSFVFMTFTDAFVSEDGETAITIHGIFDVDNLPSKEELAELARQPQPV